jgi:predicted AAA+ superfamily ATPase
MIPRLLESRLLKLAAQFPVLTVLGPRQAGKTTLVRKAFPEKIYVSLENPDVLDFAISDPRAFLAQYPKGAILDEVQRAPDLLSYLQGIVDEKKEMGRFILTGSHNYLLQEKVVQTLAGRTALLTLLPFSVNELKMEGIQSLEWHLLSGGYPQVALNEVEREEWFSAYLQTYVERDVRLIKNITDLRTFRSFLNLCAGRVGQILNLLSLATECGISHNTAKAWIGVLESSFLIFLVQPFYKNFNKRTVKAPKLYFYDSGLLTHLLGIHSQEQLNQHYARGSIFESFVLSEILKKQSATQASRFLYYWRDSLGQEVDGLIEKNGKISPLEIKMTQTVRQDAFAGLKYWQNLAAEDSGPAFLIHAGPDSYERNDVKVLSWRDLAEGL